MSRAHINSLLQTLKAPLTCDSDTSFLLSPTNNDMISDNGLYPQTGFSVNYLVGQGVISDAFAVEEGTTNYCSDPSLSNNSNSTVGTSNIVQETHNVNGININGVTLNQGLTTDIINIAISISAIPTSSTYVSFSCNYYCTSSTPKALKCQIKVIVDGVTYYLSSSNVWTAGSAIETDLLFSNYTSYGKWQWVTYSLPVFPTGTMSSFSITSLYRTQANFTAKINSVQLECKEFATSFINGSRSAGVLRYDKTIINPANGTVAFWHNPMANVGRTNNFPQMAGIGWYTSPCTRDWLGVYHEQSSWQNGITLNWCNKNGTTWSTSVGSKTDIIANQWHYVVFTWDWANKLAYIYLFKPNGTMLKSGGAVGITAMPDFSSESYFEFGRLATGGLQNAMYSNIRIDNVTRTEQEIKQWYFSQSPFYYSENNAAFA